MLFHSIIYYLVCRKSLLSEGLDFLFKVFRLFPPVDEVRGRKRAEKLRKEALAAAETILGELLSSLPVSGEEEAIESEKGCGRSEQRDVDCAMTEDEEDPDCFDVSDEERRTDKAQRQQILLNLLELACAMVRQKLSYDVRRWDMSLLLS